MDLEIAQTTTTAKFPILIQGEYDMWRLRIEQYFQVQDYALWDIIENGNSFKLVAQTTTNADGTSTSLIPGPITIEEKAQKKNDVKARSMLLVALPNEHLMTFNQYKDAKTLFDPIQTRFGEDCKNKPDLDIMSFDDLCNNFKIVEQEVKGTASSNSSSNSQNMAFVSTPNSTNKVNTAYGCSASQPNGSQLVYEDLEQIHEDDIEEMDLKWQLALLSMRTKRGPRNQDSRNRNQDSSRRTINVEETSSKAMVAIDGAGFDWSYMADDEVPTNMALMAFLDSEPEFEGYGPKTSKNVSEDTSNEIKESSDAPMDKRIWGNQRNWNNQKSQQLGSNFMMYNKACFVCGSLNHVEAHCNYHQRERVESRNNYTRENYNYSAKNTHPSAYRNMVPWAVLIKTGLKAVNAARPVTTTHPKTIVYSARPMIEAIRMFLAYASFKDFVVYQMDVKSAFLYGQIEEEVYVYQPPGFQDPGFSDIVYKVEKALYGLHQAPKAWYETLSTYLLDNGFQRGQIDKTLFIKRVKSDILLVQVYVDDIIFGSTKKKLCIEFKKLMHNKFQMSSMGELTFFLGLQVIQKDDGIFICQDKYVDEILKKFSFSTVKTASTPIETSKPLLKDTEDEDVDVHLYRSMIGSLMYLTSSRPDIIFAVCACARFQVTPKVSHLHAVKRIFRYLKSQPKLGLWYPKDSLFDLEAYSDSDYAGAIANSTTEAEYVAAASCCGQVLLIQNQMLDYGYNFMNTKIFINNESTICIVKNPVFHSKTKHIEIIHHFIRDSNEKKLIQMIKIHTDQNVIDLLTKAFDVGRFQYLIATANDEIQVSVVGLTFYYELMVNLTIYTSCIKQFWATAKAKTVNGEVQIQALVDGKKVIVTEMSVRRALQLKDVEGTECLPNATIFAELERIGRKQRKDTEVPQPSGFTKPITDEAANEEHVHVHSNDPLLSENIKTSQAAEITKLKERVKKLERRNKSRTPGLKRLRKVGRTARIESFKDEGLGAQEDASKQGRKIVDLDADAEVTLVNEAQERNDDNLMFDTGVFDEEEVEVEKVVSTIEITTASATTTTVEEQGELTIEERSKLFVELYGQRKKHFAKLRAEEIKRKPPTKAQKRNQMCTYLKNMANYKHSQLKNKSFEEIQMLFDNTIKWVDLFVPMDTKVVEGSKSQAEGSSKRTGEELEYDNSKK
ncbi:putative ribonuclease H-like domain-containing protein [Tanacetum coccineum]|uniref:Ribonuclease H-like domain-containing protein n=1 Tax=Tanacetum coccineum TaxID=301880 RepID=A0ABQ5CA86_9ASTR